MNDVNGFIVDILYRIMINYFHKCAYSQQMDLIWIQPVFNKSLWGEKNLTG